MLQLILKHTGKCLLFFLSFVLFLTFPLFAASGQQDGPVRIMPLGDSITMTYDTSWRYELWKHLKDEFDVTYVGSLTDWFNPGDGFPQQHEGHGGWTINGIIGSFDNLVTYDFDMVLVHLGTNDIWNNDSPDTALGDLSNLVDKIRSKNPNAVIVLAQIVPTDIGISRFDTFSQRIPEVAAAKSTEASPVYTADLYTTFDKSTGLSDDGVHPSTEGYIMMGQAWYDSVAPILQNMNSGDTLKARFTSEQTDPAAGIVSFDGSLSSGNPQIFNWNFGDGQTGTGPVVDHLYNGPGTYTVSLTVGDGVGNRDIHSIDVTVQDGSGDGNIAADNRALHYTGRIDTSNSKEPVLIWPGTSISTRFEGTGLTLKFSGQGANYFQVIVDGQEHIVEVTGGYRTYEIADNLQDTVHSLEIFKRTEGNMGTAVFHGLGLDDGKTVLAPLKTGRKKIEFFGDSITVGACNEDPVGNEQWQDYSTHNNYLAYGALTARVLDMDYMCTSVSGIGLLKSWTVEERTQEKLWNKLYPAIDSPVWENGTWQPDIVAVNLGQNDWSLGIENEFGPAYLTFLKNIRSRYPMAHIVCLLGPLGVNGNSTFKGYVENAVNTLKAAGDERLYVHYFSMFTSEHPRVDVHALMADELTTFINTHVSDNPVIPVKALFSYEQIDGADKTIGFDASASTGSPESYSWDFGDGTTGSGKTAVHHYSEAGTYEVSLTLTKDAGSNMITKAVTVKGGGTVDDIKISWQGSTWNSGFSGNVTITNKSTQAIKGWTVVLKFKNGEQVTNTWNAQTGTSGENLTFSNVSWNGTIAPGTSRSFGFQGTHNGTFEFPSDGTVIPQ